MEIRIKSKGSYTKSGKLFLNEFSRIQKKDSFENSEYYLDFFGNGKIKNWYIQSGLFDDSLSQTYDQIKKNEYEYGNKINHNFKIPSSLLYLVRGTSVDSKAGISEFARPSNLDSINVLSEGFNLEYNSNYTKNLSINELNKYNQITINSGIKKSFANRWTLNNIDEPFNDYDQNYLVLNTTKYFNSQGAFGVLTIPNGDYTATPNKLIENENNKISGLNKYSLLESNQRKEKVIEIELDVPNDLILQYMAKTLEDDLYNDNDSYEFKSLTGLNALQKSLVNPIRDPAINNSERTFNRFNTPFSIYNFSKKNWEYRGLFYPLKHLTKYYIDNSGLVNQITPIDNNSNSNYVTYLSKIDFSGSPPDITNFLNYFKKYHITHDCLTSTSTLMIKKIGSTNNIITLSEGKYYSDYAHPVMSIPTEQFGFPNHFKFHCFEDNLINMNNFIEKPFVLNRTNFSTNVEVIGEFSAADGFSYEYPFNICLNYFIIKQTEIPRINEDIKTNWKPFSNKEKTKNFIFKSGSNEQYILNNFEVDLDSQNSEYLNLSQRVIRKISNSNDHISQDFLTNNFYTPTTNNLNSGSLNLIDHSKKYLREIINFGNFLFLTPLAKEITVDAPFGQNPIYPPKEGFVNNRINQLILNNNFDSYKIIEYPDYEQLLIDNTLEGLIDYTGNIDINSAVKIPSEIKNNINAHMLNGNFDMPIGNYFNKLSGTRSLNEIKSSKQKIKNYNILDLEYRNDLDTEVFNNTIFYPYESNNVLYPNNIDLQNNIREDYYLYGYKDAVTNKSISQYVLYPEDKISICVSISPSIHPLKLKQLIKIKKGKCKVSLFGYHENEKDKIYDENRLLKNYKSNNFPNIIIGDIVNTNEYSSNVKESNYLNYLDKQYTKDLEFYNSARKLLDSNPSLLLEGRTFLPYIKIENEYQLNTKEKCIYDDALLQFPNKNAYELFAPTGRYFFKDNIFKNILRSKNYEYRNNTSSKNFNYNVTIQNLNLKSESIYFSSKRFGHLRDIIEQRKYTTMYNIINQQKEPCIQKVYINQNDGQIISDLTNVYGLNKSLTYELVDSKGAPVTTNENAIGPLVNGGNYYENLPFPFYDNIARWNTNWSWSYNDILNLKHVAFRENVAP
jgi:hypothetical protein